MTKNNDFCNSYQLLVKYLKKYFLCYSVQGNAIAVTALVTTGRFFMNWAGSVCTVYIQELFPTSFR